MSLFNAFGQNGFAALAQTLENIGNIVAPIAPEEEEQRHSQPRESAEEDEENEEETFDDRIQGFFNNFRDKLVSGDSTAEMEPSSPGSFVSVELGDSPRSVDSKGTKGEKRSIMPSNTTTFGLVSGVELEKKVQEKYREQLEAEVDNWERKYGELQRSTSRRIALLEEDCKEWRQLAESTKSAQAADSEAEREDEINVLYEKLGAATNDLEARDEELSAAQQLIAALTAEVSHLKANNVSAPMPSEDLTERISELQAEVDSLQATLTEASEQLEVSEDRYSEAVAVQQKLLAASGANEEQLTTLTNQLRASNKTIAALEQKLLDAQQQESRPGDSEGTDGSNALLAVQAELSACQQTVRDLQQELAERTNELAQRDDALAKLQEQEARLHAETAVLMEKLRVAEEEVGVTQRALDAESVDSQHLRDELHRMKGVEMEHEGTITSLNVEAERSQAQIRELSEKSDASAGSLSDALAEVQGQLRRSEEERGRLEAELEVVRAASDDLTQQLESTSANMAMHQDRAEALQSDLQVLRIEAESAAEQLANANQSLSAAEARVWEVQAELSAVQEEVSDTRQRLDNSTASLLDAQKHVERLQRELVEERAGSQDASQRLHTVTEELSAARQRVQELQNELASHRSVSLSVPTESTTLASTSTDEATSPKSAAAGSSASEEALATLQAEYNKAIKKIKIVNKQLKDKDAEIARLKEETAAAGLQPVGASGAPESEPNPELEQQRARLEAAVKKVAELEEALAASEDALKSTEEVAWHAKAEAGELLFALEQEQRTSASAVQGREDSQRELEEIRLALKQAQDTSTSAIDVLKVEVDRLHAALEQERASNQDTVRARDALQEQLTQILSDARRMNRADSMDSNMSDMEKPGAGESSTSSASAVGGADDSTLASARLEYSKAVKKIKIMTKQLKSKDEELTGLRAQCETQAAEVAALSSALHDRESDLAGMRAQLQGQAEQSDASLHRQSEADGLRKHLQDASAELEGLREELARVRLDHSGALDRLESALQDATTAHEQQDATSRDLAAAASEIEHLRAAAVKERDRSAGAVKKIAEVEEALAASEEALKSTEEVAWHAKAEAGELLFALEQEQRTSASAVQARDELEEKLAACQLALKQAQVEAAAGSKIVDIEGVRDQLRELHGHLAHVSRTLRFSNQASAGVSASPAKDGAGTFEHLLQNLQSDLVSALSMLSMSGRSLSSLAEQIMAHLKDATERANALEAAKAEAQNVLRTKAEKVDILMAAIAQADAARHTAEAQWESERASLLAQADAAAAQVASLRRELDEHASHTVSELQKLQAEKQQAQATLASFQSASAQAMEQIQPLKAMVQKYEVENKQLHQVIAQLRQVRKTSKGESDNAIAERDELRAQCTALQGEVAMLQDSLRAFTANDATVAQLREDMSQIAARLAATERTLESTRRSLAQREKECYDKDAELEVTRSDMLIARQDLERKIVEVANLQEAVSQIESEKNFAVSRYQRDLAERTSAFKMQAEQEKSRIEGELRRQLEEEHARRVQLEASTQEYELFYRKADMEFNKEKKKMQRTLENALAQLSNSQAQVIDRMLVANLIVSYFKRRRSTDVLKIIAKVLAFDDEQLIAVGLKVPPIDLIGTLLTTVMGRPAPPPEVEGNNLAEQWINFLINESDQEASNSAGLVPRARSNSNGSSGTAGSPRHLATPAVTPPAPAAGAASSTGGGKLDPDARKQA